MLDLQKATSHIQQKQQNKREIEREKKGVKRFLYFWAQKEEREKKTRIEEREDITRNTMWRIGSPHIYVGEEQRKRVG